MTVVLAEPARGDGPEQEHDADDDRDIDDVLDRLTETLLLRRSATRDEITAVRRRLSLAVRPGDDVAVAVGRALLAAAAVPFPLRFLRSDERSDGVAADRSPRVESGPATVSAQLQTLAPAPPNEALSARSEAAALALSQPTATRIVTHTIGDHHPVRPVSEPAGLNTARRRSARAALWVRNAGLIVLLFLAYQLWGTRFQQAASQGRLRAAFAHDLAHAANPVSTAGRAAVIVPSPAVSTAVHGATAAGDADTPTVGGSAVPALSRTGGLAQRQAPVVLPGGVVARIQIPRIGVDQFVVEGTAENDLQEGPGHYTGTPLPGQPGNAAIAGHRTTYGAPFNRLAQLQPGDTIFTTTTAGRFEYVVASQEVVLPSQTDVIDDYGDNRLTLTTCTPEFSATHRLVVVATFKGPVVSANTVQSPIALAHTSPPPTLATRPVAHQSTAIAAALDRARTGFDGAALPLALILIGLLTLLGLAYRPIRRRCPPIAAATLLAPFWLITLLLLFEQLNRFLPSNV